MALTDNLVGFWPLGTDSNDSVGGYNGTNSGNVTNNITVSGTSAPSNFTKCTSFDGNADYITTSYTTALRLSDFSFSFWVYFDAIGTDDTIIYRLTAQDYFIITLDGGDATKLDFVTSATTASRVTTATSAIASGQWYHIVCTRGSSGTILKTYINSGTPTSATVTARDMTSTEGLTFGRNNPTACLNGKLLGLGFWNRELTSGEVTTLYNGGAGLMYPFSSTTNTTNFFMFFN